MKLSKRIREQIIENVIKEKGCLSKIKVAEDIAKELTILEWEKNYPKDIDILAQWASTVSYVHVINDSGYTITTFHLCRRMYEKSGHTPRVISTDEISAAIIAIDEAKKEHDEIESLVRSVVYSCDTDKQLIETAPELARFIPDGSAPVTALVDMATVNKLRAMFGS